MEGTKALFSVQWQAICRADSNNFYALRCARAFGRAKEDFFFSLPRPYGLG
jgi:hypothetical protein